MDPTAVPKVIEQTAEAASTFLKSFVPAPVKGMVNDYLAHVQWENRVRLAQRAKRYLQKLGLDAPGKAVALKVAYPLIQNALLEDDPDLQERWAHLLAAAATPDFGVDVTPAFADVLRQISPRDAAVLEMFHRAPARRYAALGTWTLPERLAAEGEPVPVPYDASNPLTPGTAYYLDGMHQPSLLAVDNLVRLGLLVDQSPTPRLWVALTPFGYAFADAVARVLDDKAP